MRKWERCRVCKGVEALPVILRGIWEETVPSKVRQAEARDVRVAMERRRVGKCIMMADGQIDGWVVAMNV